MSGTSSTSPLVGLLGASALLLAASCVPLGEPAPPPAVTLVTVESVVDGDSFRASHDGQEIEFRLAAINAPELDECHGSEAASRLRDLIGGRTVQVVSVIGDDQFGRTLAQVHVDESNVNLTMVASGDAIATSDADFFHQQEEARLARLGLWSASGCGPEGAPLPRLAIVAIDYNPPGDDANETVTIANQGDEDLDLSGYVLRDESSVNRFVFPPTTLSPGEEVIVNTGCDQPDGLSWCSPQPVWNNSGDTALLLDPSGRVVAFYHY